MKPFKMESEDLNSRVRSLEIEVTFLKAQHKSDLESVRQLVNTLFHQVAEQQPSAAVIDNVATAEAKLAASDSSPESPELNAKFPPLQPSSRPKRPSPRLIPRDFNLYPCVETQPDPLDLNDGASVHNDSVEASTLLANAEKEASSPPKLWVGNWTPRLWAQFQARSIGRSPEETERLRKVLGYEPRPDIPYYFTDNKPRSPLPSVIRPVKREGDASSDADEPSVYYSDSDEESIDHIVCNPNEADEGEYSDEDNTLAKSGSSKNERSPATEDTSPSPGIPDALATTCANDGATASIPIPGAFDRNCKASTSSVNCPVPRFDFGTDGFTTDSKTTRMNLFFGPQSSAVDTPSSNDKETPITTGSPQAKRPRHDDLKPSAPASSPQSCLTTTPTFTQSPSTDRVTYIRQRSLALGQRRALALAESQQQSRDDLLRRSDSDAPPSSEAADHETPTKQSPPTALAALEARTSISQAVGAIVARYGEEARSLVLGELDKQQVARPDERLSNARAARVPVARSGIASARATRRKVNYTDLDDSDRESRGGPWPAEKLRY